MCRLQPGLGRDDETHSWVRSEAHGGPFVSRFEREPKTTTPALGPIVEKSALGELRLTTLGVE